MKLKLYNKCFGEESANTYFQKIFPKLDHGELVTIDLSEVTDVDASFLFHAFGKLHETIPIIVVRERLVPVFSEENKHVEFLFKNVMTYSESFYLDKRFRNEALEFVQQNQNKN